MEFDIDKFSGFLKTSPVANNAYMMLMVLLPRDRLINEAASFYLNANWPENDDPFNDFERIVYLAAARGKVSPEQAEKIWRDTQKPDKKRGFKDVLAYHSKICKEMCHDLPMEFWREFIDGVIYGRYGGSRVYIKARRLADIEKLSPKQIMERHGVSRATAYRWLKK